jgi:hypothetical protein
MWHTESGERSLCENESKLWIHAVHRWLTSCTEGELYLGCAIQKIEESIEFDGGHIHNDSNTPIFGDMPLKQQIIAVASVTKFLLSPLLKAIESAAWSDAAISSVLRNLAGEIEADIDGQHESENKEDLQHHFWTRSIIFKSLKGTGIGLPRSYKSDDSNRWREVLDSLCDSIIGEYDFLIGSYEDALLCFPTDICYYNSKPPECDKRTFQAALRYLMKVTNKVGDSYTDFMNQNKKSA